MRILDYLVLATYFGVVFTIGISFARSQKSLKDFFLGGHGIPWWAAAFSGVATILSGVSYLGAPGLAFTTNYTFHQYRLGMPLALLVLCVVMLPIFFRLNIYSIYEYLEMRFDRRTRLLASSLFVVLKCCYLSIVIYAPSIIVAEMLGLPLMVVTLFTGLATAVYTVIGGIKAVIWTDTLQLFVLLSGLLLTLGIVLTAIPGGVSTVLATSQSSGRMQILDFSPSLTEPYTFWGGLIGGAFMLISQWGSDQSEIQRFLTTKSKAAANLGLISSMLVATVVGLLLFFIGSCLFAYYSIHPEKGGLDAHSNRVFAKFIIEEMPVGLKGLLLAAILSASMSTISTVLNSLATVTMNDFFPLWKKRASTVGEARLATVAFGVVITLGATLLGDFGNLLEATTRIANIFGGSLAGVFLLGMLSRWATPSAGFWGALLGLGVVLAFNFGSSIAFLWFGPIAATTACVSGMIISFLDKKHRAPVDASLVYWRNRK
jgi:SSS family solute:Na+ symporter